ncbi:peroxide stress protein YaaA [Leeuwenhoekiella sp. NPDC079379]|uniref:peroxide stress protein YaaA n=1 Tax=Leeuwenhoekiella sp. NPDC079379 TaxID=3364122 RepID=UPI0037C5DF89
MKAVVSPAKSLNFESKLPTTRATQPQFIEEANTLNKKLEHKTKAEISELMNISDKLADLNYQRYKELTIPFTKQNARPAVYTFDGDVYTGLDAYTIPTEKLDKLQDTLRILSGLYGVLKPLDLMQAYRLEMGTKLHSGSAENLYEFWDEKITDALNSELKEGELFLNLASQEYFKSVKTEKLKVPVVTPIFKDYKNGKLKIISFYAKKARGSMVRYIIDKDVQTIEDLKGFDYDDYGFSEQYSDLDKNELIFVR